MAQLKDGLGEMSAFVASPTYQGWGWGIRDSGRPASLYAFKPESADVVAAKEFQAYGLRNSDWEDMAWTPGGAPGTGHLWVLENVGNGWDGNRWIYQFEETAPTGAAGAAAREDCPAGGCNDVGPADVDVLVVDDVPADATPSTTTSSTTAPRRHRRRRPRRV